MNGSVRTISFFLSIAVTLAVLFASPDFAWAKTRGMYFAGYMGLNIVGKKGYSESVTPASGEVELHNATSFAGALGFRLNENLRVETEASVRTSDVTSLHLDGIGRSQASGEVKSWFLLMNAYYDFDLSERIKPFVSAGVGFAMHEGDIADSAGNTVNSSDDHIGFAYQVGSGLKYRASPDLSFTGGYRYLGSSDLELDNARVEYSAHELRVGLEYDF